jgi:hypothetical protein
MEDDARCCGTGHCMINAQGHCWCGQQWDGTKMCFAPQVAVADANAKVREWVSAVPQLMQEACTRDV